MTLSQNWLEFFLTLSALTTLIYWSRARYAEKALAVRDALDSYYAESVHRTHNQITMVQGLLPEPYRTGLADHVESERTFLKAMREEVERAGGCRWSARNRALR